MPNKSSNSSNGDAVNMEKVQMLAGPILFSILDQELNEDTFDEVDDVTDKEVKKELEQLKGEDKVKTTRETKEIAHQILYIADKFVGPELEKSRIIERIEQIDSKEGFNAVADEYFCQGGATTWGRVSTFIYVSSKVVIKAMYNKLRGIPVIGNIIHWIIEFIQNKLVPWISRVGGWNAVLDKPSNSRRGYGTVVVFGLGLVVGSFVTYYFITRKK